LEERFRVLTLENMGSFGVEYNVVCRQKRSGKKDSVPVGTYHRAPYGWLLDSGGHRPTGYNCLEIKAQAVLSQSDI
jgi:hypothetical protein